MIENNSENEEDNRLINVNFKRPGRSQLFSRENRENSDELKIMENMNSIEDIPDDSKELKPFKEVNLTNYFNNSSMFIPEATKYQNGLINGINEKILNTQPEKNTGFPTPYKNMEILPNIVTKRKSERLPERAERAERAERLPERAERAERAERLPERAERLPEKIKPIPFNPKKNQVLPQIITKRLPEKVEKVKKSLKTIETPKNIESDSDVVYAAVKLYKKNLPFYDSIETNILTENNLPKLEIMPSSENNLPKLEIMTKLENNLPKLEIIESSEKELNNPLPKVFNKILNPKTPKLKTIIHDDNSHSHNDHLKNLFPNTHSENTSSSDLIPMQSLKVNTMIFNNIIYDDNGKQRKIPLKTVLERKIPLKTVSERKISKKKMNTLNNNLSLDKLGLEEIFGKDSSFLKDISIGDLMSLKKKKDPKNIFRVEYFKQGDNETQVFVLNDKVTIETFFEYVHDKKLLKNDKILIMDIDSITLDGFKKPSPPEKKKIKYVHEIAELMNEQMTDGNNYKINLDLSVSNEKTKAQKTNIMVLFENNIDGKYNNGVLNLAKTHKMKDLLKFICGENNFRITSTIV